ncbi:MAG: tetratricopeptide repeat protein [Gemmatimonadetes bacterium]|nr:tetratricopeptide repeat protein [Gemmatimonadota bacterium]
MVRSTYFRPAALMSALLAAVLSASGLAAQAPVPKLEEGVDASLAYHLAREARARDELERAAALLELAVDLDPAAVLPRLDRVEVLLELNRPRAAASILAPIAARVEAETAARPATAARYHRLIGAVALRSGQPHQAIEGYERASRLAPWDLRIRAQLIGLHRATGDPAGAIPHLRAATEALPENAELRVELGDALLDLERYTEAEAAYLDALELTPRSSELHRRLERKIDRARSAIRR